MFFLNIREVATVVNIRDVIVVDKDQAFASVDFVASEYFNFNSLELWRILIYFSFEISMTNSDSFFDLMESGSVPISWVKLYFIARVVIHFASEMFGVRLRVRSWKLIFSCQDFKSSSSSHSAISLYFFYLLLLLFKFQS